MTPSPFFPTAVLEQSQDTTCPVHKCATLQDAEWPSRRWCSECKDYFDLSGGEEEGDFDDTDDSDFEDGEEEEDGF